MYRGQQPADAVVCGVSLPARFSGRPRHLPADGPDGVESKPVGSRPALQSDVPLSGQPEAASAFLHSYSCHTAEESLRRELFLWSLDGRGRRRERRDANTQTGPCLGPCRPIDSSRRASVEGLLANQRNWWQGPVWKTSLFGSSVLVIETVFSLALPLGTPIAEEKSCVPLPILAMIPPPI
jgi:hypothetical protein